MRNLWFVQLLFPVCALLLAASCTTAARLERLDNRVQDLLNEATQISLGEGSTGEDLAIEDYQPWSPAPDSAASDVLQLDLDSALQLAARHSREYQSAKETLYNSALSLVAAQHAWEWNPVHNISALLGITQEPESETTFRSNSSICFSKRLLSGGRLTGSLALGTLRYCNGDKRLSMDTLARLTLTQPLLGGSGVLVAREPLTQAERNLIYALRTYVRARSALLISIANSYYDVLNAEADLRIGEMSYASLKYSQERSEAMGEGGRVTQIDVDQARQRVLTAESNLVTYREAIQTAKDNLKVALAIPLETEIAVDSKDMAALQNMKLPRPAMTLEEAVQLALQQRLDFATVRDRLQDAERAVKIAEDGMRAKADLTADASAGSVTRNRISTPRFADADYSVGLDVDLPLDRTDETIALRRAQIALEQQRRQIDATRENLVKSLRLTWNNLRTYEQKITIQKMSIALAEKRVENTRMLFEDGRIAIREYLDAQDDLSNARNSLTRQLVTHRMCWLKLLHEMEDLRVDPATFWTPQLEVQAQQP